MSINISGLTVVTNSQLAEIDSATDALTSQILTFIVQVSNNSDYSKLPIDVESLIKRLGINYTLTGNEAYGNLNINTAVDAPAIISVANSLPATTKANTSAYANYPFIHRVCVATLLGLYLSYVRSLTDVNNIPQFTKNKFKFNHINSFNNATCITGVEPNPNQNIAPTYLSKANIPWLEYHSVFAVTFAKKLLAPRAQFTALQSATPSVTNPILNSIFGIPPFITLTT